jgi:hypothetical protein
MLLLLGLLLHLQYQLAQLSYFRVLLTLARRRLCESWVCGPAVVRVRTIECVKLGGLRRQRWLRSYRAFLNITVNGLLKLADACLHSVVLRGGAFGGFGGALLLRGSGLLRRCGCEPFVGLRCPDESKLILGLA